jgi:hypothetical protein
MDVNNQLPGALPPYPAAAATSAALQLRNRREHYAATIAALSEELTETEAAFGGAFAAEDAREATRERIDATLKANRQRTRR